MFPEFAEGIAKRLYAGSTHASEVHCIECVGRGPIVFTTEDFVNAWNWCVEVNRHDLLLREIEGRVKWRKMAMQ
jgi:hypothetical protein